MIEKIKNDAKIAISELIEKSGIKSGDILVIGCSSSEMTGGVIGKSSAPEAAEALLRHAFIDLGMKRIWCGHYDGNGKSRRVMEKLGFSYHHTTEGLEVLGETRTGHVLLLTDEAWKKRNSTFLTERSDLK